MKKVLIVAAIIAASAGAYMLGQPQDNASSNNVLDYIPADTPLFSAQLEPFPIKDYLSSSPAMNNNMDLDSQAFKDLYDKNSPKINFFLNLFKTYQDGLKDPELFLKTFGLPEELRGYIYTLGIMPVIKSEIANPQAIWDLLDKNELETGFTHSEGMLESLTYRSYQLSEDDDPAKVELIVAIDNGMLTITLNSAYIDQNLLANALGLKKVQNPLANSGKIDKIIKQHNFTKDSVGFINHIELIKGLTTVDGNLLARQITSIGKQLELDSSLLTSVRTEECATEFANISQNWPQTAFGYTKLDISARESTFEMAAIIESKNQPILTALQSLRGYIPKYTEDLANNVFSLGLGIDVNQLTGSLTDIWSDLQTPTYTCQPLAEMQNQIGQAGASIGMLGMGISMADGLKGSSIGILDYTIGEISEQPTLDSLDALFTVTAEDPQQIFESVKMFVPQLQQVQLSEGSEPVEISSIYPIPAEINISPKLAIKGKHLVIYNGEKGEKVANSLSSEEINANGLTSLAFDFKKIFTPMVTAVELSGETMPEEMQSLSNIDARMKSTFDINSQGLVFTSYMNVKAK